MNRSNPRVKMSQAPDEVCHSIRSSCWRMADVMSCYAPPLRAGTYGLLKPRKSSPRQDLFRWALRVSNPRPSPCKGDALPTELSARALCVTACPAHHLTQGHRQACSSTCGAAIEPFGPVLALLHAHRADQHLPPARDRPHPRSIPLAGIVGWATAEGTSRSVTPRGRTVQRPHGQQGYPRRGAQELRTRRDDDASAMDTPFALHRRSGATVLALTRAGIDPRSARSGADPLRRRPAPPTSSSSPSWAPRRPPRPNGRPATRRARRAVRAHMEPS